MGDRSSSTLGGHSNPAHQPNNPWPSLNPQFNQAQAQPPVTKFAPITFANPIPSKLDQNNFLIWQKQVSTTIKGHRLQTYLSESSPRPAEFASEADERNGIQSTAFLDWEQQDQLILSWLISSMTEGLLSRFINCENSSQVWSQLQVYFATQVRAKQAQYKTMLENTKKNSLP